MELPAKVSHWLWSLTAKAQISATSPSSRLAETTTTPRPIRPGRRRAWIGARA